MKIGIFAKTFSRPTIEDLFQAIGGYEIYSAQFNLSCVGLETLPGNVSSELVRRIIDAAEHARVELLAMSGTFNMAHPDPAVRRDNLTKFEVLCEVTARLRQTTEAFPRDPRFRRITIESRGHGASEAGDPAQCSVHTFADDIAAFIEAHRLGPIVIGGISMGAAITLHLAVHRPEIVRGLILARPAWITASAPANQSPNVEVGRLLRDLSREDAREAFEISETARHLAEVAPDNLASLRGFFSREPQAITVALLQAIAADGPGVSEEDLRKLETPTLIIGHDIDYIHPLSYAATLS
jgi:hypothetical protein